MFLRISVHPPREEKTSEKLPDIDFGTLSDKEICAWFTRQLIGINRLPFDRVLNILQHFKDLREIF